jgi:hypothetical protein
LDALRTAARDVFARRVAPALGSKPALFKRGESTKLDTGTLQQAVAQVTAKWSNAPEVVVIHYLQDPKIPDAVRAADLKQRSQGANGSPQGFYLGGKVYLLSSQIGSPTEAATVLLHETLGHYGLRGTFGAGLGEVLDRMARLNVG